MIALPARRYRIATRKVALDRKIEGDPEKRRHLLCQSARLALHAARESRVIEALIELAMLDSAAPGREFVAAQLLGAIDTSSAEPRDTRRRAAIERCETALGPAELRDAIYSGRLLSLAGATELLSAT